MQRRRRDPFVTCSMGNFGQRGRWLFHPLGSHKMPTERPAPPTGTKHKQKRLRKPEDAHTVPCQTPVEALQPLGASNLKDFQGLFKTRTGHTPKPFQIEAVLAQVTQKDVVVHAGTGSGKTAIAAGPHLLPKSKGRVSILVSPLLALHEEQVGSNTRGQRCLLIAL